MSQVRLERYLEGVDAGCAGVVSALHEAVMTAKPDLDCTISLSMLTYGVNGDFKHWVCSISAAPSVVTLRFLPGAFMRDPELLLKRATGGIRALEFSCAAPVDSELVVSYVREALVQLGAFKSA